MSTLTDDQLLRLTRRRWTMPVIAAIAARNGARFVELLHALSISRESLARTIEDAITDGWVMRNPGHGHPLRPEYILTDLGARAALTCSNITDVQSALGFEAAAFSRWSLPVVRVINAGETRFSSISRALPTTTPRALSSCLKDLTGQQLVARTILEGYPPASDYGLTANGERLARAIAA